MNEQAVCWLIFFWLCGVFAIGAAIDWTIQTIRKIITARRRARRWVWEIER